MTSITASTVLARFNLTTDDLSAAATEYVIDDVIDWINLECGTSISNLSGTAGSKSVTVTNAQNAAIKLLLSIMLKDLHVLTESESTGLGPATVSSTVSMQTADIQNFVNRALRRLAPHVFIKV